MFDHVAYSALSGGRVGWAREYSGELRLVHTLEQAWGHFESANPTGNYIDCHGWQFTPASFELLILELGEIGAANWIVDWLEPQPSVEFLVRLRRGQQCFLSAEAREARRLELLMRVVQEVSEQVRQISCEPPSQATAR